MSRDYICQVKKLLLPFSWIYGMITSIRNLLFDVGLLKEAEFSIPLIGIGNLRVGGTGKTPLTIYLAKLLSAEYKVAVLSRGYGRSTKGYVKATKESGARELGDEPALMKRKVPAIQVVVNESRVQGVDRMLAESTPPDCILLDDVMQHRWIKPGLMLMLTAFHDMFYNDFVLPVGMLREPRTGKSRADVIVVSKCPVELTKAQRAEVTTRLQLNARQKAVFSYESYGQACSSDGKALQDNARVALITGLGDASQIEQYVSSKYDLIEHFEFKDHRAYTAEDWQRFATLVKEHDNTVLLTTEKDYERMVPFLKNEKFAALPIYTLTHEAMFFDQDKDLFDQTIINYVKSYSGNS